MTSSYTVSPPRFHSYVSSLQRSSLKTAVEIGSPKFAKNRPNSARRKFAKIERSGEGMRLLLVRRHAVVSSRWTVDDSGFLFIHDQRLACQKDQKAPKRKLSVAELQGQVCKMSKRGSALRCRMGGRLGL